MPKYADKISKIEKKIEQERQQLRDLKARETAQQRKDDTRRKILYGAAILSLIESLPAEKKRESLERVQRHVRAEKDRKFLGLPMLPPEKISSTGDASSGSKPSSGSSKTPAPTLSVQDSSKPNR